MDCNYFVYVLRSEKDDKLYIGLTSNVERRLKEHNEGKSASTCYRRPFRLVLQEMYSSRVGARKRERYLKRGPGHAYLKSVFEIAEECRTERPDFVGVNWTQNPCCPYNKSRPKPGEGEFTPKKFSILRGVPPLVHIQMVD